MTTAYTAPLSPGWFASVSADDRGPALTFAQVAEAMAEATGRPLTEVSPLCEEDDADRGLWVVPLTRPQVAEMTAAGRLELVSSADGRVVFVAVC